MERDGAAEPAVADPLAGLPQRTARIDDALVVDVLAQLAAADSQAAVAGAGLSLLLEVDGVRACAVVVRDGSQAVIVGSAGYDCSTMARGATLPLDSGLPVTEAVRTGRQVVMGTGPSWIALPFGPDRRAVGALLLSLHVAPLQSPAQMWRLQRIARALGDALHRAALVEQRTADLDTVTSRLATRAVPSPGWEVVLRSQPYDGAVGGDTVLCLSDDRGGQWLIAADVCGAGLPAAVIGRTVQAVLLALAPIAAGPAELLSSADRAIRSAVGTGSFITAVVVHAVDGRLDVASAGHPSPLLLTAGGARLLDVEPGLPLALDTHLRTERPVTSTPLPRDGVVLLHTDGLLDRRAPDGRCSLDLMALVDGLDLRDLPVAADAVLSTAAEAGPPSDDLSLLLARPAR